MNDLYVPCVHLTDYGNEYTSIAMLAEANGDTDEALLGAIDSCWPIRTVEEMYKNIATQGVLDDIRAYPEKVNRLSWLAMTIRINPSDVVFFKQVYNEVMRLLYGIEQELRYPEPEFDPSHLPPMHE